MHNRKHLTILLLFLIPLSMFAQQKENADTDITGLWKGTLYNDSTGMYYQYEVGISEEKGKLFGFSHTWFILDDNRYFGVKKVKIKRAPDGKIIIEDNGLISNNYPVPPAKGVRQLNILTLEKKDSLLVLQGPFTTNRTKDFAALTGSISLQRKNDYLQSALVPHLQELGVVGELSFIKKQTDSTDLAVLTGKKEEGTTGEIEKKKEPEKKEVFVKTQEADGGDFVFGAESKPQKIPASSSIKEKAAPANAAVKNATAEKVPLPAKSKTALPIAKEEPVKKVITTAAELKTRKTEIQQTVYFSSDSLVLSLYDNGVVDGDTVSVLMNGEIIMANERLSTKAVSKTIYPGLMKGDIELLMYAENLGSIPPNTGLLVIKDGRSIYEVRFSGDLNKNASIILKRKP